MNDREDELVSSGLDDELGPEDRERLADLSFEGSEHVARARSFRHVDESLRSIGFASKGDDRLDARLKSLRDRLGFGHPKSSRDETLGQWRKWSLPLSVAAAAGLVLFLALRESEPLAPAPTRLVEAVIHESDGASGPTGDASSMEEELILALGYGDELSEARAISKEDLDVIDLLDLLDFLSARDVRERG